MSGIDWSTYLQTILTSGYGSSSLLTDSSSAASSFLPLLLSLYEGQSTETDSSLSTEGSAAYSSAQQEKLNSLLPYFEEAEQETGVPKQLLEAVAEVESGFDTNTSMGVMALMPATQQEYGVTNVNDARQNILAGAKVLRDHLDRYNGDVKLALSAYNAGSGAVEEAGGVPSYTQNYVNKVLSVVEKQGGMGAISSLSDSDTSDTGLSLDASMLSSLLQIYALQMQMKTMNSIGSVDTDTEDSSSWSMF